MSNPNGRRWQFSLLTLLIAMGIVALICLALRSPNELWATAVFAAAVFSLSLAGLAAIYRSGRTRAFALGFLVLGAGYWCLVLLAEQGESYGQPRLPTTRWGIVSPRSEMRFVRWMFPSPSLIAFSTDGGTSLALP